MNIFDFIALGSKGVRETKVFNITPKEAEQLLKYNLKNRPPKKKKINSYKNIMENNQWKLTPQGIAFSTEPCLIDGQNRLHAVQKSNVKSVPLTVTVGCDPDEFIYIDRGTFRSSSDDFHARGVADANDVANIITIVIQTVRAFDRENINLKIRPNHLAVHFFHKKFSPLIEEAIVASKKARHLGFKQYNCIGAMWFFLHNEDEELRENFFHGIVTGANLQQGSPILALRAKIENNRYRGRNRQIDSMEDFVIAWNRFKAGKNLFSIRRPNFVETIDAKMPEGLVKMVEKCFSNHSEESPYSYK